MVHTAIQLSHIEESLHKILSESLAAMGAAQASPLLYDSLLEVAHLTRTIEHRRKLALHTPAPFHLTAAPNCGACPSLASAG